MRLMIVGRKAFRVLLFSLILFFVLPLLYYFAGQLRDPMTVHFHEPKGNAIKVMTEGEKAEPGRVRRILLYIMEFYQNGL